MNKFFKVLICSCMMITSLLCFTSKVDASNESAEPYALIREEYVDYRIVGYVSHRLLVAGYGPKQGHKLLFIIPAGVSLTDTWSKTITHNIGVNGSVEMDILEIAEGKLDVALSGSYTTQVTLSTTITGPALGEADSASYYACINYDLYEFVVKKSDYFECVDQNGNVTGSYWTTPYNYTVQIRMPKGDYDVELNY